MKTYQNCKGCNANSPKVTNGIATCAYCGQGLEEQPDSIVTGDNNIVIGKNNGTKTVVNGNGNTVISGSSGSVINITRIRP